KIPFNIIDANLEKNNNFQQFPLKYMNYLAPPVNNQNLIELHKMIRWSLNINQVKYSKTKLEDTIYELQAMGNIILSSYNTGVNNLFPNIRIINNSKDIQAAYNISENDIKEFQAKGIHNIFKEHTAFHRIKQIAATLKIDIEVESGEILVVINKDSKFNQQSFSQQTYSNKHIIN